MERIEEKMVEQSNSTERVEENLQKSNDIFERKQILCKDGNCEAQQWYERLVNVKLNNGMTDW